MPPSRKKSCLACRVAKAKCSQVNPCTRCVSKNIECDYTLQIGPQSSRHNRLLPIEIPVAAARCSAVTEENPGAAPAPSIHDNPGARVDGVPVQHAITSELSLLASPQPNALESTEFDEFLSGLASVRSAQVQSPGASSYDAHATRRAVPSELDPAYSIIIGQLQSYPQKMLSNVLPPFIYPECGNGSDSCSGPKGHQCLPTALATCRTIVAMFETKTMSNQDFIWRTACIEADRLQHECMHWDSLKTLDALQASLIYLLLSTKHLRRMDDASIGSVVQATRGTACTICTIVASVFRASLAFAGRSGFIENASEGSTGPRSVPSTIMWDDVSAANLHVHRTQCVLYGMEYLLNFSLREPRPQCLGYFGVPLPCGRELWDPEVSDLEWARRYHQSTSGRVRQLPQESLCIGTIQTYLVSQSRNGASRGVPQLDGEAVTEWYEGVDELGILIWMAAMVDLRRY